MITEPEQWKDVNIPDYSGYYEVSNRGRVRRSVAGQGAMAGRILSPNRHKRGYLSVQLSVNDQRKRIGIHQLVAAAFLPPKPTPDHELNHIDTDKANNVPSNLEWVTHLDNVKHAIRHGLHGGKSMPGELNPSAKLTAVQVEEIRFLKGVVGQRPLAKRYGVTKSTIKAIHQGKNWRQTSLHRLAGMLEVPQS